MPNILITGATGGLGMVCIKALLARGYTVFALGTNENKLQALGEMAGVVAIRADVTDDQSVQAAKAAVLAHTQSLAAVVNLAGLTAVCSMVEGDCLPRTERLLAVNVMGMARTNRVFFDMVQAGHGRIINCSSEAGWMAAQPFAAPYYLCKHAVEAYSDSLRRELMFVGVPVVKLQPGAFRTGMLDAVSDGFARVQAETRLYGDVLARMKPLMSHELQRCSDPQKLARVLVRAVEARRPKLAYRVGTGKMLAMLSLLPASWVDGIYRLMFRLQGWKPKR